MTKRLWDGSRDFEQWRKDYQPDQMWKHRARNGVGRPPYRSGEEWSSWSRGAQADHVNGMVDGKYPQFLGVRRRAR